jgi:hypothetical protein
MSVPAGRWTFDSYAAVWLFTDNDRYYPAMSLRSQDPILALQGHVSYTLGRRTWLAINGTWYSGGQTRIGETANADLQRNTRLGATWSQLITARQSLKFAYSTGAITRVGADFRTITAAWQIVFF